MVGSAIISAQNALNGLAKKQSCRCCPQITCLWIDLQTHLRTVHEGKKDHKCPECDKCFGLNVNMQVLCL